MDLKRLVTHFAYKIEPKPEGGFIAHATDPTVPALEAPTRVELQQKIQQNILNALAAEFPGLKLPSDGKKLEMAFHVEHRPGGGFSIHSADPNTSVVETTNQKEFENHFLEKFLNFAGKHLAPELSQALAVQVGSATVKVVVNRKTAFTLNTGSQGITFGAPKSASPIQGEIPRLTSQTESFDNAGELAGNNPIEPEPSNTGRVFGFSLVLLILCGLIYFFFHYR